MLESQVQARLQFLRQNEWRIADITRWFGIDFGGERYRILQQFLMWDRQDYDAAFEHAPATINRCKLELFLQTRQWVSKRGAALALAVTDASFEQILRAAVERNIVLDSEAAGLFSVVYTSEFISGFYKRFPALRKMVFPELTVFFDRLHEEIEKTLRVTPQPVMCRTAEVLGQRLYANSLDAITEEPMSQVFRVFLETKKPLQLRPDACSMLTYVRFESILGPARLGSVAALTDEQSAVLHHYVRSQ